MPFPSPKIDSASLAELCNLLEALKTEVSEWGDRQAPSMEVFHEVHATRKVCDRIKTIITRRQRENYTYERFRQIQAEGTSTGTNAGARKEERASTARS